MLRAATFALLALLIGSGAAEARYRVGISEKRPAAMFAEPAWQRLGLRHVRYVVPWDWTARVGQQIEVHAVMTAARAAGQDVLVTFGARSGCYDRGRYSSARACRAPGARAYRNSVREFDDRYPWVRTYSAWNEVNHVSQPTFGRPRLAARYFRVLRREARRRGFRVMAADVLDTANMHRYLRSFLRRAPGRPRLWGLHNYQDANDRTSMDTRRMLRTVRGQVWLTETSGVVRFEPEFPYSETRAARGLRWIFRLASRFDSRGRARRSRIARVYVHEWFGTRGGRFDAGIVDPDGSPRRGYFVLERRVRSLP
jgi:hypothetical protein